MLDLCTTCRNGDVERVKYWIEQKVDLNAVYRMDE
jgi:hypothetical protein